MLIKLVRMSITILQLLAEEYDSGRIDLSELEKQSKVKIQFLKENIHAIHQKKLRYSVESTLEMYDEIFGISE